MFSTGFWSNFEKGLYTHTMYSFGWHTVEATPPMVHQGLTTVCPPVTVVPASRAESLKPLIINGTTTSRSFSVIFVLTPSNMSMLSHSVTPIAYKSLRTLAHAILPVQNAQHSFNTWKFIKSMTFMNWWLPRRCFTAESKLPLNYKKYRKLLLSKDFMIVSRK